MIDPGPAFSVRDVHTGWRDALRQLGCQVADFNLGDRCDFYTQVLRKNPAGELGPALDDGQALGMVMNGIKAACYEFWPDVVLVVSAFYIPDHIYRLLRSRNHKIVILHTEEPYEHDRALRVAEHADLNVLNDPTNLEAFLEVGDAVYIPHAYDPDRHKPGPADPDLVCDFAFVGTGYPSRIEFFEQVAWPTGRVSFAGNWQWTKDESPIRRFMAHELDRCTPNDETVRLYNSCKLSANLYRREAERPELSQGWAMGPREVELAASGTFFLRESRREGDEVLSMLPVFGSPAEFGELLGWWLERDKLRDRAVLAARDAVADRTFVNNAKRLLNLL